MTTLKTISATGAVGHEPFHEGSFHEALKRSPDFLGADAGSGDIGPYYLGADAEMNPEEWTEHDLEELLCAARERGIPLLIGSAGGTGTAARVDEYVEIIRRIAHKHRLPPFRLARIYSDIDLDYLKRRAEEESLQPLGAVQPLASPTLAQTARVVAMMGVEPYIAALDKGAEVIIAGRSCDDAIFAALPVRAGLPRGLSYHLGKTLECASLVGSPSMAKESVLGVITETDFTLEPMHPAQRCTPESVAAHSLYERVHPYIQGYPGGHLDTGHVVFEQITPRATRVSGSRFVKEPDYKVKLEGAGFVGYRALTIGALRDPISIATIDGVLAGVLSDVRSRYASLNEGSDYTIVFHQYGKNAVMGVLEPKRYTKPHELCIVTEVVANTADMASSIARFTFYRLLFPTFQGQKGTAGGLAMIADEVLEPKHQAYRWTVDHLLPLTDPLEVFEFRMEEIT